MAEDTPVDGNLDFKGGCIKNGGFETFETLPITFQGTQITFAGKVYTWNVTEEVYKCDADYLVVGGRNLLIDNTLIYDGSDVITYTTSELYPNTQYILSINPSLIANYPSNANIIILDINDVPIQQLQDWNTLTSEIKFTSIGTISYGQIYKLHIWGGNICAFHQLYPKCKLEQGNVATDWTPAPEDKLDVNGKAADSEKLDGIDSTGFQKVKIAYIQKAVIAPTSNDFWLRIGSITSFSAYSITNLVIQSMNSSDAPRVLDINIVLNYWANSVRIIQNIATSYNGNQSTWGQTELIVTEDQKVWLRFVGSTQNFVHKMIVRSTDDSFVFLEQFNEILYEAPTNILRSLTFMEGALNTSDLDIKVKRVIKAGSDDSNMLLGGGGEKPISDFVSSVDLQNETTARTNADNAFSTNISNLTTSLTALQNWKNAMTDADTDNIINTVSEVLALFQNIPETTDIMALLNAKVNISSIVDNCTSVLTDVPLSANQGRVLYGFITTLQTSSHTHSNKTILDAITAAFTTEDKSKLDSALQTITKAMVEAVLTGTITTHTHLGLIRVSQLNPLGLLHWDDYLRFDRQAGYCQVSLTEIESVIDSTSHDIEFTNYTLDIDDNSGLYNNGGSFRVVEERTYELSATVGIYTIAGQDLTFALQLINYSDSGSIIKERIFEVSAANNWITLDISALVKYNVDTDIGLRIETPNTSYDIMPDNRTWFSVHEIK